MKANKAPEKIYLEKVYPDNGILPNGLNYNQSPNDIEYTRTDAFIEKAVKWLDKNFLRYNTDSSLERDDFVKGFKKAMKRD